MLRKFCVSFVIPGALTADKILYWKSPSDCTLLHTTCHCVTQDATIIIGTKSPTDDNDAFLESQTVTAGTTAEYERTDYVDDQFPRISDGDVVTITVGHGSECVDFTIVMTFGEG